MTAACSDGIGPRSGRSLGGVEAARAQVPGGVVSVVLPGGAISLWPYLGNDFSGTPQDPVNLIFTGPGDARHVRAALLRLDGNRAAFGFPAAPPFDCTWSDAIGDLETGYGGQGPGWGGSAIQLQCGGYGPLRFHLRLLDGGGFTYGNAHFELLIPGTADHQVLSWELAEQLVTADLARSGLLAAMPAGTAAINASPFRTIPTAIYNGLPAELKALVGGPAGDATADVPIANDGHATVLQLGAAAPIVPGVFDQDFVLTYGQVIPKPFCSTGPLDFLQVAGPVHLVKRVTVSADGAYSSEFHASGTLTLTPFDVVRGIPSGPSYQAMVRDAQTSTVNDAGSRAEARQARTEMPPGQPARDRLAVQLVVGGGASLFHRTESCD